jgi:hypothetical protein
VPVVADVFGDSELEIILDGRKTGQSTATLYIVNADGFLLHEYEHGLLGNQFGNHPNTVVVADILPDETGNEIAFVDNLSSPFQARSLQILTVESEGIEVADYINLPVGGINSAVWLSAYDFNTDHDPTMEVVVSYEYYNSGFHGGLWIYDWDDASSSSSFMASETWDDEEMMNGIQALGELPSGTRISLSRKLNEYESDCPAQIFDPDEMGNPEDCTESSLPSDNVLCCMMADWDPLTGGLDRVVAVAENQCFAWDEDGIPVTGWPESYDTSLQGEARPPFPALGELDSEDEHDYADLIAGTREGAVYGLSSTGTLIDDLGFPYILPSEIYGGFAIADIDRDGYVEVVFGTMDNYLHVWELGECETGFEPYAPWPQSQHDAARTGTLTE